ncbi:hypothetical protein LTR66_014221 [Elasticomyces elasticus]|nr:hypothetical protein LTR66_014221 [Elasticomyces elasticus]
MERDLSDPGPTVDLLSEQTSNHGTLWDTMHARKKTFSLRFVRTRMARHKLRASTASNGADGKSCVDNNARRGKDSTLAASDRHSNGWSFDLPLASIILWTAQVDRRSSTNADDRRT